MVSITNLPRYTPRGKDPRYPLDRRLGGPQKRSERRGYKKNPFAFFGARTSIARSSSQSYSLQTQDSCRIRHKRLGDNVKVVIRLVEAVLTKKLTNSMKYIPSQVSHTASREIPSLIDECRLSVGLLM
jgi:hypothetical protein